MDRRGVPRTPPQADGNRVARRWDNSLTLPSLGPQGGQGRSPPRTGTGGQPLPRALPWVAVTLLPPRGDLPGQDSLGLGLPSWQGAAGPFCLQRPLPPPPALPNMVQLPFPPVSSKAWVPSPRGSAAQAQLPSPALPQGSISSPRCPPSTLLPSPRLSRGLPCDSVSLSPGIPHGSAPLSRSHPAATLPSLRYPHGSAPLCLGLAQGSDPFSPMSPQFCSPRPGFSRGLPRGSAPLSLGNPRFCSPLPGVLTVLLPSARGHPAAMLPSPQISPRFSFPLPGLPRISAPRSPGRLQGLDPPPQVSPTVPLPPPGAPPRLGPPFPGSPPHLRSPLPGVPHASAPVFPALPRLASPHPGSPRCRLPAGGAGGGHSPRGAGGLWGPGGRRAGVPGRRRRGAAAGRLAGWSAAAPARENPRRVI